MQFEISIEGPPLEVRALENPLKGLCPVLQPLPRDGGSPWLRMVLVVDGPEYLERHMIAVSTAVGNVERTFSSSKSLYVRVRNLAYSEPPGASPQFAEPFHPIPQLTIRPDSHSHMPPSEAGTIYLDPGHAFGTGKHPSTILCLQVMQRMATESSGFPTLQATDVLDFGCGTGLLAIAAVKMGARRALGVEIDPDSAGTARRNVLRNNLSDRIEIQEGSWGIVGGQYDVIVANLVPAALLRSIPHLPPHLHRKGVAVIAGFGIRQSDGMRTAMESSGLHIFRQVSTAGWTALVAHKTS